MRSPTLRLSWLALTATATITAATPNLVAAGPLADAYEQALSFDNSFNIARQQLAIAAESPKLARAFLKPQLNLVASISAVQQEITSDFFGGFDEEYIGWAAQLQLSGPVWHRELKAQINRGDNELAFAQLQFAAAGQSLIQRLINSYLDLLSAREEQKFAVARIEALNKELSLIRSRYRAGSIARTDVDEARARSDRAKAALIDARTLVETAEDAVLDITGGLADTLPDVTEQLTLDSPKPASPSEWMQRAKTGNLAVLLSQQQEQLEQNAIDIARAEKSPRLDYSGQFGVSDQSDSIVGQRRVANEIQLQLTVPIYAGGRINSNVRRAEASYSAQLATTRSELADVLKDTRRAFRNVEAVIRRNEALQTAIRSEKAALRATRDGYRAGTRTIDDLLNSRVALLAAKRDAALARYDYLRESVALQQLAGELDLSTLKRFDQLVTGGRRDAAAQLTAPASKLSSELYSEPQAPYSETGNAPFELELKKAR